MQKRIFAYAHDARPTIHQKPFVRNYIELHFWSHLTKQVNEKSNNILPSLKATLSHLCLMSLIEVGFGPKLFKNVLHTSDAVLKINLYFSKFYSSYNFS